MKNKLFLSAATIGFCAASLLTASAAFAQTYKGEVVDRGLQSGLYLGGQLGYDSFRVHQNINLGSGLLTANPMLNSNGMTGGLFAGYGRYFKDYYYLGGEVVGSFSTASTTYSFADSLNSYYLRLTTSGGMGLAALPGVKLNHDSLAYVRLGCNWDRMTSLEIIPGTSLNTARWIHGFVYGLGIETLVHKNWSARVEYTHTQNYSYKTALAAGTNFNISDNRFLAAVLYHFA